MKFLLLFLLLMPIVLKADSTSVSVTLSQNNMPSYNLNYEFFDYISYLDVAISMNQQIAQPYLSMGLQLDRINLGIALADNLTTISTNTFSDSPLGWGPELGYKEKIGNGPFYFKENNNYLDFSGTFYFSAIIGVGLNL